MKLRNETQKDVTAIVKMIADDTLGKTILELSDVSSDDLMTIAGYSYISKHFVTNE